MPSSPQTVATVVLFDYFLSDAGVAIPNVRVSVVLNSTKPTTSISPPTSVALTQQFTTTDANGYWQFSLIPSANLSPANTTYTVQTPDSSYDVTLGSVGPYQSTALGTIVNVPVPLTAPAPSSIPSLLVGAGEPGIDTAAAGALILGDNNATSIELGAAATAQSLFTAAAGEVISGGTGATLNASGDLAVRSVTVSSGSGPYVPAVGLPAGSTASAVDPYNVRAYGAKLDGVTDDTAAWYSGTGAGVLEKIPAAGGRVEFPPGVSIISSSIKPSTKTVIQGHGRNTSMFKMAAGFPNTDTGLIEYTGTIQFGELRSLGFDLTAPAGQTASSVHQIGPGSMQHFVADDIFGDLGGQGGVGHQLFFFESLASTATGSFNLSFNNIYAHNGAGTVQLYCNANGITSTVRGIWIRNIFDLVDVPVGDDRIAIVGNGINAAVLEVRDFLVDGHFVQVASGLASGTVNAVKVDTGAGTAGSYVHDFAVRNVWHRNLSPTNVLGSPISFFWTTPGAIQNYLIDNVHSVGTSRIKVWLVRQDAVPTAILSNIFHLSCWDTKFNIEIATNAAPSGDEIVVVENFALSNTAALGADAPVGIGFVGLPVTAGCSGSIVVDKGYFSGLRSGVSNMVKEDGTVGTSAWTNIFMRGLNVTGVTKGFTDMMGTWRASDSPGLGPSGDQGNPFGAVPASPGTITNTKGRDANVFLHTGAAVTVSVVALNGSAVAGLTMGNSATLNIRMPANATLTLTYAGGTPTYNVFYEA